MSKAYLQEKCSVGAEYARPSAFNPAIAAGFESFQPSAPQLPQPSFSKSGGEAESCLNDATTLAPPPSYDQALAAPNVVPPPVVIHLRRNDEAEETRTNDNFCIDFWDESCSTGRVAALAVCSFIFGFVGMIIAMMVFGSMYLKNCPAEPQIPNMLIAGAAVISVFFKCTTVKKSTSNSQGSGEEHRPKQKTSMLCILGLILFLIWLGLFTFWVPKAYKPSFNVDDDNYCHPNLYNFSCVVLASSYVILLIILKC